MSNVISLPGLLNISDTTFDEQIIENLIAYFNWGLLGVGAFLNVRRPSYQATLKLSTDPNFAPGTSWEAPQGNWVWEQNIPYSVQPITIGGIYLNGVFLPPGNTTTPYTINYPLGQVNFTTSLPANSLVQVEYSYRKYNFYSAEVSWFQQVVFDPLEDNEFYDILSKNRILLPAIILEGPIADTSLIPYQLGDYSVWEQQAVLFHIIAESSNDRDKFIYILKRLFQHSIDLYDVNSIANANAFPLDSNGSLNANVLNYPDLVQTYPGKRCIFWQVRPQDVTPQLPLFRAIVRVVLTIVMP